MKLIVSCRYFKSSFTVVQKFVQWSQKEEVVGLIPCSMFVSVLPLTVLVLSVCPYPWCKHSLTQLLRNT